MANPAGRAKSKSKLLLHLLRSDLFRAWGFPYGHTFFESQSPQLKAGPGGSVFGDRVWGLRKAKRGRRTHVGVVSILIRCGCLGFPGRRFGSGSRLDYLVGFIKVCTGPVDQGGPG